MLLAPILLLAAVGVGVVYVRLANGPVSLSYLKPAIERQIANKLGGLSVSVEDVILSMVDQRAEFRLTDVRVMDHEGSLVAQAPLASMQIDRGALFRAQVQPTGIILIRPQMRLSYSEEQGLSLSFRRTAAVGAEVAAGDDRAVGGAAEGTDGKPVDLSDTGETDSFASSITVLGSIVDLVRSVRTREGTGTLLDTIGVRSALIELDHGGKVSRWGVPNGDLQISHQAGSSVVSGLATVAEREGRNIKLSFSAEAAAGTDEIVLRSSIRDVQPSALVKISPQLAALGHLRAPVSLEGVFQVGAGARVRDGRVTMEVGEGFADLFAGAAPVELNHGRIVLDIDQQGAMITVASSTIGWGGGNHLVFGGVITPPAVAAGATGAWTFDLKSTSGSLVAAPGAQEREALQRWGMKGRFSPGDGVLNIDAAELAVAGGSAVVAGSISSQPEIAYDLHGRIGEGPARALSYLWPTALAPDGRTWLHKNVAGGRVESGTFSSRWSARPGAPFEQKLSLRGRDVQVISPLGALPVYAPQVLVQLDGVQLEVSGPQALLRVRPTRALALRQLKFEVADFMAEQAFGELSFAVGGSLEDAVAVLSATSTSVPAPLLDVLRAKASGKIEGRLRISMPLSASADRAQSVTGSLQLNDVNARDVFSKHDLSGGTFKLQLAERSLNADGEMLIAGVATKLAWQYILDAPLESQPPLRLTAKLDEADRSKLGIDINHMVSGLIDVDVNVIPLANGRFGSKVLADLTNAEISVRSLAWVKPAGRQMLAEFDVADSKRGGVLLDNVRVVGDGVAIKGQGTLDARYQLSAFELPRFSIDRVTRLEIKGNLGKDDVWKVFVKGQTFEGRSLFRSLFQTGRAGGDSKVPGAQQMGVDLTAEVENVLGFWNTKLSNVRLSLTKRQGLIQSMQLDGRLANEARLQAAVLRAQNGRRELHALSADAGQALMLVGFYPNARSGRLELVVGLDQQGVAEKSGILLVRKFEIRGDEVVGELTQAPRGQASRRRVQRAGSGTQSIYFDWMRVPFVVGQGQFILQGAELRGPVVGATIEGKADFEARSLDLSGTYVPLQGLNGAIGAIPGVGQLLAGPNGEGVLGVKFALRGPMNEPEMLVNPLSMMAPGIFREIFQASNPSMEVTRRQESGAGAANEVNPQRRPGARKSKNWRAGAFGENGMITGDQ